MIPSLAGPVTDGSLIDLSFLSPKPAGADGRLRVKGEHLVDGRGRRVFLFGTNLTDYHNVPAKADSAKMALRLKQLGFNFVRLHYADWTKAPDGLMMADMETIDPEMLDRFHYLVHELKQNGIYVNINLHVARRYAEHPPGGNGLGKVVDRILPRLIESQKSFARQLLSPKNPYTNYSLASDPAVAQVEINNENSLLHPNGFSWSTLHTLPEPDVRWLAQAWNTWLKRRYGSAAKLRAAWASKTPLGSELLPNGQFRRGLDGWEREASGGAESTLAEGQDGGQPTMVWTPARQGSQDWNHQVHAPSVNVKDGKTYRLVAKIRGTDGLRLSIRLMLQQAPWSDVAPGMEVVLGPGWQTVSFGFKVANPGDAPVRLSLNTNNQLGRVEASLISLKEGDIDGLGEGQDPAKGSVPFPAGGASSGVMDDLYQFMVDRELGQTKELKDYLVKTLKVQAPITDTQASYGGLSGLLRARLYDDIVDNHGYPMHPNVVSDAEKRTWWATGHGSMTGPAMPGLAEAAMWRIKGKPYTVGEFDLNPPNHFAAETIPLLSLLASYQGWAGIAEYAWMNFQPGDLNPDRIRYNFGTTGHAGQMATIPGSALMARLGLVQPARREAALILSNEALRAGPSGWGSIPQLWGPARNALAWSGRLAVAAPGQAAATRLPDKAPGPLVRSDTGQIVWDARVANRPILTLNAPAAKLAAGFVAGRILRFSGAEIAVEQSGPDGAATVIIAALDGLPLESSKKVLAALVGRVENKGQAWHPDGSAAWFGEGPTLFQPMTGRITLPGYGWKAVALDGTGKAKGPVFSSGSVRIEKASSPWILFTRG